MIAKTFIALLLVASGIMLLHKTEPSAVKPQPGNIQPVVQNSNPYRFIREIPVNESFNRVAIAENSFGEWLRSLALKNDRTVYLFDGSEKRNQSAQFAVLDIPVGTRDLQQCADAVMRLRAMYLFDRGRFSEIVFYDNDGKAYRFQQPFTKKNLDIYLEKVFARCGSASLEKQLKPVAYKDIKAGDVLIKGGFPGHAEIVVDVAMNRAGKKQFLLAQSYMPAQSIHILKNPAAADPWYEVSTAVEIQTPEYTFSTNSFRSW